MRSYSDEEASVCCSQHSDASPLEARERVMRRLPKRARLAKDEDSGDDLANDHDSTAAVFHSSESGEGQTPKLVAPSSSTASSVSSVESPSTPTSSNLYQPLFAPVEQLVKQLAANTVLFGGAHSAKQDDAAAPARHPASDREEDDDTATPVPAQDLSVFTPDGKLKTPAVLLAEDDHRFGDDALQLYEADEGFHPYRQFEDQTRGEDNQNGPDSIGSAANKKKRKVPSLAGGQNFSDEDAHPNLSSDNAAAESDFGDEGEELGARADFASPMLPEPKAMQPKGQRTPYTAYKRLPLRMLQSQLQITANLQKRRQEQQEELNSDGISSPPARKSLKAKALPSPEDDAEKAVPTMHHIQLINLYDPSLEPSEVPSKPQEAVPETTFEVLYDKFLFASPPNDVILTRMRDMEEEKEKLRRAREFVRLRAKELELARRKAIEDYRKNGDLVTTKGTGKGVRHVVSTGVQTDGGAPGGRIMAASRWSSTGPVLPLPPDTIGIKNTPRKAPPRKGKKKRAAHANANNVHHRDNYVPSRRPGKPAPIPAIEQPTNAYPSLGLVAPDNAFSAAGYHPQLGTSHLVPFFAGPDEWLCGDCEFSLLFGDTEALHRMIKKRKNVLKIRKKAQKRAAKAASGQAPKPKESKAKPAAKKNSSAIDKVPAPTTANRKHGAVQTEAQEEQQATTKETESAHEEATAQ